MLIKKRFTYLAISIGLASILTTSANATCSNLYCIGGDVGIGGMWNAAGNNPFNNPDIDNFGGYLNLSSQITYANRVKVQTGVKVGGGKINSKGILKNPKYDKFLAYNLDTRIGINLLTTKVPLFINFVIDVDGITSHKVNTLEIGGELEGSIPINKARILYSAGYNYIMGYNLYLAGSHIDSYLQGGNSYSLNASLGLSFDISENNSLYIKFIGKYTDLSTSITINNQNLPYLRDFTAMIEFGFRGVRGYNNVEYRPLYREKYIGYGGFYF